MAEPDIEVEGPDGQVFAFPAGTAQDVMRGALAKHYAAPRDLPTSGQAGDASAAIGRGLISGVPVVGPYLLGGVERGVAGIRALQNDTKFTDELKNVRGFSERTAAEHPVATGFGEFGGGAVATAPLMATAPAAFGLGAGPVGSRAVASMLTGGAIGSGDAAVRSGGDAVSTAVVGGVGAGLGAASPVFGAVAGRGAVALAERIRPAAAPPTIEALKEGARAAYQRADDAGLQIGQQPFADMVMDLVRSAKDAGIDKTIHPKATAAVGRLEEAVGSSPTLNDAELLRRVLKGAAGSIEPDERRIAKGLVDRFDDRIGGLQPDDVVSGDAQTATDALREGRGLWARARKAETVDEAVMKAERRAASTGSGGNVDNATRQNVRAILDNPKKARGFTADEREAMERVVRGTPVQNAARLAGKLSPEGNGLSLMLSLIGAGVDPRTLVAPAVGFAAKRFADAGTDRNVRLLDAIVRNGGTVPVSPLALPFSAAGERLGQVAPFGFLPVASQRLSGSR